MFFFSIRSITTTDYMAMVIVIILIVIVPVDKCFAINLESFKKIQSS